MNRGPFNGPPVNEAHGARGHVLRLNDVFVPAPLPEGSDDPLKSESDYLVFNQPSRRRRNELSSSAKTVANAFEDQLQIVTTEGRFMSQN